MQEFAAATGIPSESISTGPPSCITLLVPTAAAAAVVEAVIAPLFNKFETLPAGSLRSRIEALTGTLKFPLKKLYQMDGSKRSAHSNAYM